MTKIISDEEIVKAWYGILLNEGSLRRGQEVAKAQAEAKDREWIEAGDKLAESNKLTKFFWQALKQKAGKNENPNLKTG